MTREEAEKELGSIAEALEEAQRAQPFIVNHSTDIVNDVMGFTQQNGFGPGVGIALIGESAAVALAGHVLIQGLEKKTDEASLEKDFERRLDLLVASIKKRGLYLWKSDAFRKTRIEMAQLFASEKPPGKDFNA